MPTPLQSEGKDAFISRCVSEVVGEGKDQDQAVAICHSLWENKEKAMRIPSNWSIVNEWSYATEKAVVPFRTGVESDRGWSASAATRGVRDWAAGGGEFDLKEASHRSKYKRAFTIVLDQGMRLGDYKLPHHEVVDDRLVVNRRAVSAAIGALNGARGGMDMDDGERRKAFRHLTRHLEAMGVEDLPALKGECFSHSAEIAKVEDHDDHVFVLAPVLVPEKFDKQGDIVSAEVILEAAHAYMEHSQRMREMHEDPLHKVQAVVVESYIQRGGIELENREIPDGSWLVGVRVYDETLKEDVRSGKMTGFSIGGSAVASPGVGEMDAEDSRRQAG